MTACWPSFLAMAALIRTITLPSSSSQIPSVCFLKICPFKSCILAISACACSVFILHGFFSQSVTNDFCSAIHARTSALSFSSPSRPSLASASWDSLDSTCSI
uniref:Secreted protein n=1 Tax=Cacopsylla melanoneura TaxID=428564 RepID=A0A8D8XIY6_9HEMI